MNEPDGFREFVETRSRDLLRSAWLISGDWHLAEDLVQAALVKTWPRWNRLTRADRPELYVRRVMLTTYLAWRKRRSFDEIPIADVPEVSGTTDADVDASLSLVAALRSLPPWQRAVVVLRYFDDLTETDTAHALGCSVGTVKTQASRAMGSLRRIPGLAAALNEETHP